MSNNIIENKLTEPAIAIAIAIHLHNQWRPFVSPITFFSVQVHWEGADLTPISLIDHSNMLITEKIIFIMIYMYVHTLELSLLG